MRNSLVALFLASCACAAAADLGTLFHTPQERKELDKLRRGEPETPVAAAPAPAVPDPAITGYVKRSDGKSTVFLDKRPYPARDGKIQGLLEPRVIERYEPLPPPPQSATPPSGSDERTAESPDPAKGAPVARSKNGKGN